MLDELWKVARGEVKYAEWMRQRSSGGSQAAAAAPPVSVPQELVNVQAYLLWEKARPCAAVARGLGFGLGLKVWSTWWASCLQGLGWSCVIAGDVPEGQMRQYPVRARGM